MRQKTRTNHEKTSQSHTKLPLIEHLHELRRRIFYVAVSVALGSAVAYGLEKQLIDVLLQPSHGQHFIYTSPLGGINFIFSFCLYVGIAVSLPVIIYNLLRFLQPLMQRTTQRFITISSITSGVIALGGIAFGYYVGLPAALHFLLHQFNSGSQIQALLTIQAYLSFVMAYLLGSALMFQLPLLMICINRITPLKPGPLFRYEKIIIVLAVVAGFIMNPSPNLMDQMFVVVPLIAMYQVGILLVWLINRGAATKLELLAQDSKIQAERAVHYKQLKPALMMVDTVDPDVVTVPDTFSPPIPINRGLYVDSVRPPERSNYQLPVRQNRSVDHTPWGSSN